MLMLNIDCGQSIIQMQNVRTALSCLSGDSTTTEILLVNGALHCSIK